MNKRLHPLTLIDQMAIPVVDSPCYEPMDYAPATTGSFECGEDCARPGTYDPFGAVTRWAYGFEYSVHERHPEDSIRGAIPFNVGAGNQSGDGSRPGPDEFIITEESVGKTRPDGIRLTAAQVTLKLTEDWPRGVGRPLVEIPGFTCEREESKNPGTETFLYRDSAGDYLAASVAQGIPVRRFVLPDLNVFERQNAQARLSFGNDVGTASEAAFIDPCHPHLDCSDPIDLARAFSADGSDPVRRPLACQLCLAFQALFAGTVPDDLYVQLEFSYEYSPGPGLPHTTVPVSLMPYTQVSPIHDVIPDIVTGLGAWLERHSPSTRDGRLNLDLSVRNRSKSPILRLRGLYLRLADLAPSQSTAAGGR